MRVQRVVVLGWAACVFVIAVAAIVFVASGTLRAVPPSEALEGRAPHPEELQPSVEAAFQAESYRPRTVARLRFFNRAPEVILQVFRVGPEGKHTVGDNEMEGVAVTRAVRIGGTRAGRVVRVGIRSWPSGLYFARLSSRDGRVGFAPVVVGPQRLGEHRVAVVMPTNTWQAYNIRDDNKDGKGDSWYARWDYNFARLGRPFLNRGVPYHFRSYDLRFLHWLVRNHKRVDFLADANLDSAPSGELLAQAYDLIVFPGHHEYVTTHEYDVIESYRNHGGNLVFLSANNFFWQVVKHGRVMQRTKKWRDLGRPEAALIGVQFTMNQRRFGSYVVQDTTAEPWLLAGTGLHKGSVFSHGGIENDQICSSSPRNVHLVARIPNVFGPGINADMTIYRTKSGGTVFAAGAFTLASGVWRPDVSRLIENLWVHATSAHSGRPTV